MHDPSVLYGIIAFLVLATTWSVSWGISARVSRPQAAATVTKPAKIQPGEVDIARSRAKRTRVLRVEQIALLVADQHRFEDSEDYPILPGEMDEAIDAWCDDNEVERVSTATVRELIAQLPFVTRPRVRINLRNPVHRGIRARQEKRGEINDRPTVYIVANLPAAVEDGPATVRPEANVRPAHGQKDRSSVRPKDVQRPAARPESGHELGAAAA